jgi:hypothetical protein
MLKTGLEFAPGTTEKSKKMVGQMFPAEALLSAYRTARGAANTSDIVLVTSDQSPDISGGTRMEYCRHLKKVFGTRASAFRMWSDSAHSVMKLPPDSEAMWLVVDVRGAPLPVMCVIYATPYKLSAAN